MIRMDYVFRFVWCCLTHSMCVFFARDVRNQEVQRGAIAFKSCACQRMHFCCKWGRNRWSVELHPCSTTQRGGRCRQIPTMSRKYLYLHGYQGKCRGFLDCQIVASMDIIKYTIYIYHDVSWPLQCNHYKYLMISQDFHDGSWLRIWVSMTIRLWRKCWSHWLLGRSPATSGDPDRERDECGLNFKSKFRHFSISWKI